MLIKKKLTKPDIFLIAANIVPIIGAWFFDWDARQIFMVYALETVIIGFFTLVKMAIATAFRKKDTWFSEGKSMQVSGLFFMFFFLIHYGFFVAIQTGMFVQVSGISKEFHMGFFDFFLKWPQYLGKDAYYMLAGFVISYGFNMIWNFVRPGHYRTVSLSLLMFQPYIRIFIQQLTVILGSMFLIFGAGKIFIIVFAFVKTFFEVIIDYESILKKSMADLPKKSGQ